MDMQWCMWRRNILGLTKDQPLKRFLSLLLQGQCRYSVGMEENWKMFLQISAKNVECAKHPWIHLVGDQPEITPAITSALTPF